MLSVNIEQFANAILATSKPVNTPNNGKKSVLVIGTPPADFSPASNATAQKANVAATKAKQEAPSWNLTTALKKFAFGLVCVAFFPVALPILVVRHFQQKRVETVKKNAEQLKLLNQSKRSAILEKGFTENVITFCLTYDKTSLSQLANNLCSYTSLLRHPDKSMQFDTSELDATDVEYLDAKLQRVYHENLSKEGNEIFPLQTYQNKLHESLLSYALGLFTEAAIAVLKGETPKAEEVKQAATPSLYEQATVAFQKQTESQRNAFKNATSDEEKATAIRQIYDCFKNNPFDGNGNKLASLQTLSMEQILLVAEYGLCVQTQSPAHQKKIYELIDADETITTEFSRDQMKSIIDAQPIARSTDQVVEKQQISITTRKPSPADSGLVVDADLLPLDPYTGYPLDLDFNPQDGIVFGPSSTGIEHATNRIKTKAFSSSEIFT